MKWFEIKDRTPDKAEIWIYEQIGEDFWTGGGVLAKNFQKELAAIKAPNIDLHINSPGGVVFDGLTIYNLLKQHPANVTTYIDGVAASIASVIALSGQRVIMAENALFMIHNPYGMAVGDASVMRKMAESLEKVGNSIAMAYKNKTGAEESEIASWMNAESWFTAEEAIELGFADEISDKIDMAACAKFVPAMEKMGFKKIPEVVNVNSTLTIKDAERALRDRGFSRNKAKEIVAKGYRNEREAQDGHVPDEREAQKETMTKLRDAETQDAKEPNPHIGKRIIDRHLLPNYGGSK